MENWTEQQQVNYRQSVAFLLMMAVRDINPEAEVISRYSIHKGLFFELDNIAANKLIVRKIEMKMRELAERCLPIERQLIPIDDAVAKFKELRIIERANLLISLKTAMKLSEVIVYTCGNYSDMFYGDLVSNTRELTNFKLNYHIGGLILRTPMSDGNMVKIHPIMELPKLTAILSEAENWASILHCDYVPDLNRMVRNNVHGDLIRVSEALHEKKIANIADHIKEEINRLRLICIAGPSSSGKTSFAQRLRTQLRVNGIEPISISLDDYYVNRNETPLDEKGEYDFEALEAIDLNLFNEHLVKLMQGEEVIIPRYNFITGKREWEGREPISVTANQPIIIEGIHGLNERLTASIPRENKYKIYVSALTPLSIDAHNRIPTTQARLLRRLVRDYKTRGFNGEDTLRKWPSVRAGEEKNIFPYQEEADEMFNSALIYELAMLKKYAVEMLLEVPESSPQYPKAKELLDFCRCFEGIDDEYDVPNNSILREFIGGSVFFR